MPYPPIFSSNAARIMLMGVGASTCASGSHVWNGTAGTLIRKQIIASTKNQRATCIGMAPFASAALISAGSWIRSKLPCPVAGFLV